MEKEKSMESMYTNYCPDVLGDGCKKLILKFSDDYEGEVISTLVRRTTENESGRAILYIHGFNDYFFQKEMAKKWNQQGYNFFALDLRKYGRSYLSHQKLNNVRSILEYDEEIDLALRIIKSENNHQVILMGHSTGGLIITNYAVNHINNNKFHGLICNSPFYEFNLNYFKRTVGIPILSFLGRYLPNVQISAGFSEQYGYSLHKENNGEWNYALLWKPHDIPKVNLSFIKAIHEAQKNIRNQPFIDVPVLVMHSNKSIYEKRWSQKFTEGDAVLNVNHMREYANKINGDVTVFEVQGGMHDLFLSKKLVREIAFQKVFKWIHSNFI